MTTWPNGSFHIGVTTVAAEAPTTSAVSRWLRHPR
ncbi:Uncharacterised protein [Mycobacteroides abscessus subsp. abscessus]|nr:Uncharacterised protein [Mycobacteroides abscessus subsp. abscessus]